MHRKLAPTREPFLTSRDGRHISAIRECRLRLIADDLSKLSASQPATLTINLNTADILYDIFICLFVGCIALRF